MKFGRLVLQGRQVRCHSITEEQEGVGELLTLAGVLLPFPIEFVIRLVCVLLLCAPFLCFYQYRVVPKADIVVTLKSRESQV